MYNEIEDDIEQQSSDCIFTKEDLKSLARSYMVTLFNDKRDRDGLKIHPEILFTERNISLVLNSDICNLMPAIYAAIAPRFRKENAKRKSKISADVECVLNVLNECSRLGIPKCCAAGLLAVYVEVYEGCEVDI
jgi:hypothetical protein